MKFVVLLLLFIKMISFPSYLYFIMFTTHIMLHNNLYILCFNNSIMGKYRRPTKETSEKYNEVMNQGQDTGMDSMFPVHSVKSQYSMWGFIFQELANLRMELSRLGVLVRINNQNSPKHLTTYHAHIYSFLIPISVVIESSKWNNIEQIWLGCKQDIQNYLRQKSVVPNKKIPFELILKLDKLYRIALLAAQKAGLGITIESDEDIDSAIEKAITGG